MHVDRYLNTLINHRCRLILSYPLSAIPHLPIPQASARARRTRANEFGGGRCYALRLAQAAKGSGSGVRVHRARLRLHHCGQCH